MRWQTQRPAALLLALLLACTLDGCGLSEAREALSETRDVLSEAREVLSEAQSLLDELPETSIPDPGTSNAEIPDAETSNTETPDAGTSNTEIPDAGTSNTEIPDAGTSSTAAEYTDTDAAEDTTPSTSSRTDGALAEDGSYDSRDEVALYLVTYRHLPGNYITKTEARALGWSGGSLEPYAPGKCIGGDRFGNREGLLPEGHTYTECDIDTLGKSQRGAKRLVFDESFSVYYTGNHYESFTLLYGEETP